jgi:hypothetical protein
LKNIVFVKDQMVAKLNVSNIETNSYEKIYEMYIEKFGKDAIVLEYDKINQLLSDFPLMTD